MPQPPEPGPPFPPPDPLSARAPAPAEVPEAPIPAVPEPVPAAPVLAVPGPVPAAPVLTVPEPVPAAPVLVTPPASAVGEGRIVEPRWSIPVGRSRLRLGVTLVVALGLTVAGTLWGGGGDEGVAPALTTAMLVGSVLAHEGAHAVAARALGYRVEWIVLGIVDGRTSYSGPADRPLDRAAIAMAGPAVSAAVALGLVGAWASGVSGPADVVFHAAAFNVLTFAVNLVPVAGSDGQLVLAGLLEDRRRGGG